jgi:hypothetical protein
MADLFEIAIGPANRNIPEFLQPAEDWRDIERVTHRLCRNDEIFEVDEQSHPGFGIFVAAFQRDHLMIDKNLPAPILHARFEIAKR